MIFRDYKTPPILISISYLRAKIYFCECVHFVSKNAFVPLLEHINDYLSRNENATLKQLYDFLSSKTFYKICNKVIMVNYDAYFYQSETN